MSNSVLGTHKKKNREFRRGFPPHKKKMPSTVERFLPLLFFYCPGKAFSWLQSKKQIFFFEQRGAGREFWLLSCSRSSKQKQKKVPRKNEPKCAQNYSSSSARHSFFAFKFSSLFRSSVINHTIRTIFVSPPPKKIFKSIFIKPPIHQYPKKSERPSKTNIHIPLHKRATYQKRKRKDIAVSSDVDSPLYKQTKQQKKRNSFTLPWEQSWNWSTTNVGKWPPPPLEKHIDLHVNKKYDKKIRKEKVAKRTFCV